MRFGINALSVATGGNVTYFANMLPELARLLEQREDVLYVYTRAGGRVKVPSSPALHEVRLDLPGLASSKRILWEQTVLPALIARDRLDVFFGPADTVPLAAPCPTVCALRNPNVYADISRSPRRKRPRLYALRALALASARRSRRVIFVSAAARDVILPALGVRPERARVVHHGLGEVFMQALQGERPMERPYLLTVSTVYRYKNFVPLIRAYERHVKAAGFPHALVIIGASADDDYLGEMRRAVAELKLENDVILAGEVAYPAVGAWYWHAAAFVFPSWRETFGHPLLEAMAAGLPMAAADIPVMREVGGPVPIYFDPFSEEAMGEALRRLLSEDSRERVAAGRQRLRGFTWKATAEATLRIWDEAAGVR